MTEEELQELQTALKEKYIDQIKEKTAENKFKTLDPKSYYPEQYCNLKEKSELHKSIAAKT